MLFSARISTKSLAQLCLRLSMALEAGIDVRTVWKREAERAAGPLRRRCRDICYDIDHGASLSEAIIATGNFFPSLVGQLVEVGEQAGHTDVIFRQLAEHYQQMLTLRRNFLRSIAWPAFELGAALFVIGGLIFAMGILREITGDKDLDILGFGWVGISGLANYLTLLASIAFCLVIVVQAIRRGTFWGRSLQHLIMKIPGIGGALRTLALARLAWALHLTMNAGMPVRRALATSLRSTHNAYFTDQIRAVDKSILQGNSLYETFRDAGEYPPEFLDAVAVAEESGKMVETMAILSRQYRERATEAIALLTKIAGAVVWVVIGAVIIFMIFRVFSYYVNYRNEITGVSR